MPSSTNLNSPSEAVTDVVWIQTAFAGDIVLSTGALKLLQERLPHIRQHVITTSIGLEILKGVPFLTSTQALPKSFSIKSLQGFLNIKKTLKKKIQTPSTTRILQPHRSSRSSLLRLFLGYQSYTWKTASLSWTAHGTVDPLPHEHETMRVAKLLSHIGIEPLSEPKISPYLAPLPLQVQIPWQRKIQDHTGIWVAFAPGSVWGTKQWQMTKYLQLAHLLLEKTPVHILWIGGPQEKKLKAYIPPDHPRMIDTIGETSFDDLRRFFPRLQLLVSNDSSPVHFASAFNIPTVTIWGATAPSLGFSSLSTRQKNIEQKLPCRPCHSHGPQVCPKVHFKCMNETAVETVAQACLELLSTEDTRHKN
ncbi:MAG: glycosyltransferase family 9 protein [Oligoflexales bacterium]